MTHDYVQTRPSMPFWKEETDKPEPTEIPAAEGHAQEEAFAGCFVLLQPGSGLQFRSALFLLEFFALTQ